MGNWTLGIIVISTLQDINITTVHLNSLYVALVQNARCAQTSFVPTYMHLIAKLRSVCSKVNSDGAGNHFSTRACVHCSRCSSNLLSFK